MLSKAIFLVTIVFILGGLIWLFSIGKLSWFDQTTLKESFSQFVEQKGADEYVIAELTTNEQFSTTKMGLVTNTNAKISLVAHYKYYIKLAELTYRIENGIVFIYVTRPYLSTPVAFNFFSVREVCDSLLGLGCEELLGQLKRDISAELIGKGISQMNTVYDKAAKALADNLNNHFKANGYGRYYKSIVVTFASEESRSQRQFNYNDGFCKNSPCPLELDVGKIRELIK